MKILVTWIGFNEDFDNQNQGLQFVPSEFTGTIHRDVFDDNDFQKHIILCTTDKSGEINKELNKRQRLLQQFLKDHYPKHLIELIECGIDKSDLQDFPIIESALRAFF